MRMRGDMTCFHEPFGEAWYQGDDALWPRLKPGSPRQPGLTSQTVLDKLLQAANERIVFSKDMPQFTDHLWSDEFLSNFTHTFIIRDPAKVLTSVFRNEPDFVMKEFGFIEQRKLFDRLIGQNNKTPPIIDSDDLLENPASMVEAYCEAVGIPFIPEALSWEPGDRDDVLWYDQKQVWHAELKKSDGLKAQPPKHVDISNAPDKAKEFYDIVLPHYEYLYQHRLTI